MSDCEGDCALGKAWQDTFKVLPPFRLTRRQAPWSAQDWIWAIRVFNAHGLGVLEVALLRQDILWKANHQPYHYERALTYWIGEDSPWPEDY